MCKWLSNTCRFNTFPILQCFPQGQFRLGTIMNINKIHWDYFISYYCEWRFSTNFWFVKTQWINIDELLENAHICIEKRKEMTEMKIETSVLGSYYHVFTIKCCYTLWLEWFQIVSFYIPRYVAETKHTCTCIFVIRLNTEHSDSIKNYMYMYSLTGSSVAESPAVSQWSVRQRSVRLACPEPGGQWSGLSALHGGTHTVVPYLLTTHDLKDIITGKKHGHISYNYHND